MYNVLTDQNDYKNIKRNLSANRYKYMKNGLKSQRYQKNQKFLRNQIEINKNLLINYAMFGSICVNTQYNTPGFGTPKINNDYYCKRIKQDKIINDNINKLKKTTICQNKQKHKRIMSNIEENKDNQKKNYEKEEKNIKIINKNNKRMKQFGFIENKNISRKQNMYLKNMLNEVNSKINQQKNCKIFHNKKDNNINNFNKNRSKSSIKYQYTSTVQYLQKLKQFYSKFTRQHQQKQTKSSQINDYLGLLNKLQQYKQIMSQKISKIDQNDQYQYKKDEIIKILSKQNKNICCRLNNIDYINNKNNKNIQFLIKFDDKDKKLKDNYKQQNQIGNKMNLFNYNKQIQIQSKLKQKQQQNKNNSQNKKNLNGYQKIDNFSLFYQLGNDKNVEKIQKQDENINNSAQNNQNLHKLSVHKQQKTEKVLNLIQIQLLSQKQEKPKNKLKLKKFKSLAPSQTSNKLRSQFNLKSFTNFLQFDQPSQYNDYNQHSDNENDQFRSPYYQKNQFTTSTSRNIRFMSGKYNKKNGKEKEKGKGKNQMEILNNINNDMMKKKKKGKKTSILIEELDGENLIQMLQGNNNTNNNNNDKEKSRFAYLKKSNMSTCNSTTAKNLLSLSNKKQFNSSQQQYLNPFPRNLSNPKKKTRIGRMSKITKTMQKSLEDYFKQHQKQVNQQDQSYDSIMMDEIMVKEIVNKMVDEVEQQVNRWEGEREKVKKQRERCERVKDQQKRRRRQQQQHNNNNNNNTKQNTNIIHVLTSSNNPSKLSSLRPNLHSSCPTSFLQPKQKFIPQKLKQTFMKIKHQLQQQYQNNNSDSIAIRDKIMRYLNNILEYQQNLSTYCGVGKYVADIRTVIKNYEQTRGRFSDKRSTRDIKLKNISNKSSKIINNTHPINKYQQLSEQYKYNVKVKNYQSNQMYKILKEINQGLKEISGKNIDGMIQCKYGKWNQIDDDKQDEKQKEKDQINQKNINKQKYKQKQQSNSKDYNNQNNNCKKNLIKLAKIPCLNQSILAATNSPDALPYNSTPMANSQSPTPITQDQQLQRKRKQRQKRNLIKRQQQKNKQNQMIQFMKMCVKMGNLGQGAM